MRRPRIRCKASMPPCSARSVIFRKEKTRYLQDEVSALHRLPRAMSMPDSSPPRPISTAARTATACSVSAIHIQPAAAQRNSVRAEWKPRGSSVRRLSQAVHKFQTEADRALSLARPGLHQLPCRPAPGTIQHARCGRRDRMESHWDVRLAIPPSHGKTFRGSTIPRRSFR